jgi:hypothetical protein
MDAVATIGSPIIEDPADCHITARRHMKDVKLRKRSGTQPTHEEAGMIGQGGVHITYTAVPLVAGDARHAIVEEQGEGDQAHHTTDSSQPASPSPSHAFLLS